MTVLVLEKRPEIGEIVGVDGVDLMVTEFDESGDESSEYDGVVVLEDLLSYTVLAMWRDPGGGLACEECGAPTASREGVCYECQCRGHAEGWFDMDGDGRR
jgi:hypothetical protein